MLSGRPGEASTGCSRPAQPSTPPPGCTPSPATPARCPVRPALAPIVTSATVTAEQSGTYTVNLAEPVVATYLRATAPPVPRCSCSFNPAARRSPASSSTGKNSSPNPTSASTSTSATTSPSPTSTTSSNTPPTRQRHRRRRHPRAGTRRRRSRTRRCPSRRHHRPTPHRRSAASRRPRRRPEHRGIGVRMTSRVYAIGDSVMQGAGPDLYATLPPPSQASRSTPSRTGNSARPRPRCSERLDAGEAPDVLIVHLGTNGLFAESKFDEAMVTARDIPHVLVVNVKAPRNWETAVNERLAAGVDRHHEPSSSTGGPSPPHTLTTSAQTASTSRRRGAGAYAQVLADATATFAPNSRQPPNHPVRDRRRVLFPRGRLAARTPVACA